MVTAFSGLGCKTNQEDALQNQNHREGDGGEQVIEMAAGKHRRSRCESDGRGSHEAFLIILY